MIEFQNKNDYSISAFSADGFLCKYVYFHSVTDFVKFLDSHERFHTWITINVYSRRSGRFIGQFRKGQMIPPKPR